MLGFFLWLLAAAVSAGPAFAAVIERVSVASDGSQAEYSSLAPAVSAEGRYVAFDSHASNLVPEDANDTTDVFRHDRSTGETIRVSVASDGAEANGPSQYPSINADGRYIAFRSEATNLVAPSPLSLPAVYVHDCETGDTVLVAEGVDGFPSISYDGRFVACATYYGLGPIYLHDLLTGETEAVSVASDGHIASSATYPDLSAHASRIVFSSSAADLVPGDTNGYLDVFIRDRATSTTFRANMAGDSAQADGPTGSITAISPDGRYITFDSRAANLVAHDTNGLGDVFIHDTDTGATNRANLSTVGAQTEEYDSYSPDISSHGRYVVFVSADPGLIADDTNGRQDVFIRDTVAGTTERASVAFDGSEANGPSWWAAISASGRCVAFLSEASNLVPDDTNEWSDIFVYDQPTFPDASTGFWAYFEVEACHTAAIVQGYPDGLYRPGLTIIRDQMAVYISRALAGGEEYVPTGPAQATFPDVPTDYWAYDHIEYTVANNVVQGYEDGDYHPDWEVTRGQMAVFVARSVVTPTGEAGLSAYEPPEVASFADVPTTYWCYKHVEYCKGSGIVAGYPDGTYKPTQYVTRDQMAVYIQRAFQLPL
jgi:Tol biopolymer transport system component